MVTNNKNVQILVLKMPEIKVNGSPTIGSQANNNEYIPHF